MMPARDHDHIGYFTDQVKLTQALVRDLDEAIKEVNLLEEHEEESSQKITKLEVICKRLRKDAQRLREERTTLEGMIQSHDELILEMAEEYGLNRMGENDDDEDNDDEGNAIAPPASVLGGYLNWVIHSTSPKACTYSPFFKKIECPQWLQWNSHHQQMDQDLAKPSQ
jgi:hypothetical protein